MSVVSQGKMVSDWKLKKQRSEFRTTLLGTALRFTLLHFVYCVHCRFEAGDVMSRKTTRQLIPLKQAAGDYVDEDYGILCPSGDDEPPRSRVAIIVLSLCHILLALASIALGVAAICTSVSGYYIGYGLWCGFIVSTSSLQLRTRLFTAFKTIHEWLKAAWCNLQCKKLCDPCCALQRWASHISMGRYIYTFTVKPSMSRRRRRHVSLSGGSRGGAVRAIAPPP